jgi:dihydrofolate reductase
VFFVGGADLYAQVLARADHLYLTEIQADYQGDAHFPEFDRALDGNRAPSPHHPGRAGLSLRHLSAACCSYGPSLTRPSKCRHS